MTHRPSWTRNLETTLKQKLQQFYDAEIAEWGENPDRLAKPAGPLDADLAIILHNQTEDGPVDGFWDMDSPTIQGLNRKGFNAQFTFCYDWH
jgi:hypothetical protein